MYSDWLVVADWLLLVAPWIQVFMTYLDAQDYEWQPAFHVWLVQNKEHMVIPCLCSLVAIVLIIAMV